MCKLVQYVPDIAISSMGLINCIPMMNKPRSSPSSVARSRVAHHATIPFTLSVRSGPAYSTATGKLEGKLVSR